MPNGTDFAQPDRQKKTSYKAGKWLAWAFSTVLVIFLLMAVLYMAIPNVIHAFAVATDYWATP